MSVYQHKRSATAAAAPTAGELQFGEIAVNTADGNAFTRLQDGSVFNLTTPLPSRILQEAASTGQVLMWSGSIWAPTFQTLSIESLEQGTATEGQAVVWDDLEGMWMAKTVQPNTLGQASATSGQCLAWNGSAWQPSARLTRSVDVQTFTSSGTWTKPAGAVSVAIQMSGGGAGGNYGSTTGSSPSTLGGAAGEGIVTVISADLLGSTEDVTIGAGGTGGVGAGVGGTPAAVNATFGNPTRFGTTEIKAFALGGGGGSSQFAGNYTTKQNQPSFSPSVWGSGGATSAPNQAGASGSMFSGGGGAGAVALGAAGFSGGVTNSIALVENVFGRTPVRGGGGAGGATGATGGVGGNGAINGNGFASGGGGGGAPPNGSTTAMGGNGGAGIRGSGGGGGGRGGSTSAGSNGGAGGNGFAIITTVCYT